MRTAISQYIQKRIGQYEVGEVPPLPTHLQANVWDCVLLVQSWACYFQRRTYHRMFLVAKKNNCIHSHVKHLDCIDDFDHIFSHIKTDKKLLVLSAHWTVHYKPINQVIGAVNTLEKNLLKFQHIMGIRKLFRC